MKFKVKKIASLAISLAVSVFVFIGLLIVQNKVISPQGKVEAYLLKDDISKRTVITDKNIGKYFEKELIDGRLKVSNGVESEKDLLDHVVLEDLNKGTVVAKNYFIDKNSVLNKMKNPMEVSLTTSDVSEVLGGTLREGDVVTISQVDKDSAEKIINDAYVTRVFSNDNKKVEKDSEAATMTINMLIPASDVDVFNNAVTNSKIRLSMNK